MYIFKVAIQEQATEIHNLMTYVYEKVTDKDTFVCDDLLYVKKHICEDGFIVVALEDKAISETTVDECDQKEQIVACLIVDFPGDGEENLGRDIGLEKEQLGQVVHMDSAVVHPAHRGCGLQSKMIAFAETIICEQMRSAKSYFLSTASPNNPASFKSLEKMGYVHVCTKEKYGGLVRRIYVKGLPS